MCGFFWVAVFVVCAMNLTLSTIIRLNVNHFGQTMRRCVCVCGLVAAHYANGKHKIDLCNLFVIATMPYIGQHERWEWKQEIEIERWEERERMRDIFVICTPRVFTIRTLNAI